MLSADGIQPLPEKLDSITNMPHQNIRQKWSSFWISGVLPQVCAWLFIHFKTIGKADEKRHTIHLDKAMSPYFHHAERWTLQSPDTAVLWQ